jgi:enoyl-CoA hydratase/carnithine racemase
VTASYSNVDIWREAGIAEVRLHTNGGPFVWSPSSHNELAQAFTEVADDRDVRVVILTGTGSVFCTEMDHEAFLAEKLEWHTYWWEGRRIMQRLLDIDVPVIGVLNGPATVHAELLFLSDVVLAADTGSVAEDHFESGAVPGDGVHIVWPHVLGPQRGKYFLLTDQTLSAAELLRIGAVNEVLPRMRSWDGPGSWRPRLRRSRFPRSVTPGPSSPIPFASSCWRA